MNPKIVIQSIMENMKVGRWTFISMEDAIQVLRQWIRRFPVRYDLIVGVPRAGMMFGSIIANNLGTRLSSPELLPSLWNASNMSDKPIKNILVVEDSITRGTKIIPAQGKAIKCFPDATVHIGSLFINEKTIPLDTYGAILPPRGLFEWELMHLDRYLKLGCDLDGVICANPSVSEGDDFVKWLPNAKPFLIPLYGVHAIITSRNEAYRDVTVEWLRKNGVEYRHLIMDPAPIGVKKDYFRHKVDGINLTKPDMFFESGDHLAWKIHWATGVPTLATDTMRFFGGEHGGF